MSNAGIKYVPIIRCLRWIPKTLTIDFDKRCRASFQTQDVVTGLRWVGVLFFPIGCTCDACHWIVVNSAGSAVRMTISLQLTSKALMHSEIVSIWTFSNTRSWVDMKCALSANSGPVSYSPLTGNGVFRRGSKIRNKVWGLSDSHGTFFEIPVAVDRRLSNAYRTIFAGKEVHSAAIK